MNFTIGVIADDFTGAMDTGVKFVTAGLDTALLFSPQARLASQVQVISTHSRDLDRATAQQRTAVAARSFQGKTIFKKIDSTMRGHVGGEIETVLQVTGLKKAVICPAVIELGRTVRQGQLWINERLLHESDFAHDPAWPATISELTRLLGLGAPAEHLYLDTVRAGSEALAEAIAATPTPLVSVDACTVADLEIISRAIVAGSFLPCGALGLAQAWLKTLVGAQPGQLAPPLPASAAPVLIVAGSRHPQTHLQVSRLIATQVPAIIEIVVNLSDSLDDLWPTLAEAFSVGRSVILRSPPDDLRQASQRRALELTFGQLTRQVCQNFAVGGLVLTGGETAMAVCQALEAEAVQILGEFEAGIPWGRLLGGSAANVPLVTKAGGFGQPDSLVRIMNSLYQN